MWPSKPEVFISPTVWQISLQFRRQIWGFRPRPERRNWSRAIATTTDNRKLQYGLFARQYRNFWQPVLVPIIWLIFYRARHHRKSRIWRWNFRRHLSEIQRCNYFRFWEPHRYFRLSVAFVLLPANTILYYGLIPQICRWNFNCTFHSFRKKYFRFRRHFQLSVRHYWNRLGTLPASLPRSNAVGSLS